MEHVCETIDIQTEPSVGNPTGKVTINKEDLVEGMQLFGVEKVKVSKVQKTEEPATPWNAKQ